MCGGRGLPLPLAMLGGSNASDRRSLNDRSYRDAGLAHGGKSYATAKEEVHRATGARLADERPQSAMVFAKEIEHLLGLGGLGKGRVSAQIAEHNDDLAAMAFQDPLVALRDDQFGKLRREEPL